MFEGANTVRNTDLHLQQSFVLISLCMPWLRGFQSSVCFFFNYFWSNHISASMCHIHRQAIWRITQSQLVHARGNPVIALASHLFLARRLALKLTKGIDLANTRWDTTTGTRDAGIYPTLQYCSISPSIPRNGSPEVHFKPSSVCVCVCIMQKQPYPSWMSYPGYQKVSRASLGFGWMHKLALTNNFSLW